MKDSKNNLARAPKLRLIFLFAFFFLTLSAVIYFISYRPKQQEIKIEDNLPPIRISVLNGCGFQGAARTACDRLLDKNVDIISSGNARKFIYDKTLIIVRKDDKEDLERLQRITGIKRKILALNQNSHVSFEIILGRDFEEYFK